VMCPRSSSMGRSTSASVTVKKTVTHSIANHCYVLVIALIVLLKMMTMMMMMTRTIEGHNFRDSSSSSSVYSIWWS